MSKCREDAFPGYGGDSVRDVVGGMGRLGKVDSILSSVPAVLDRSTSPYMPRRDYLCGPRAWLQLEIFGAQTPWRPV